MSYINFKEEKYVANKELRNRKKNNSKLFEEYMESKDLGREYVADNELSFKEFQEKHFGNIRIVDEDEFLVIENKDVLCSIFNNCSFNNIKFKECKFIGCTFNDCKFHSGGVIFENCIFVKEDSSKKPTLNNKENFSCCFNKCSIYAKFTASTLSYGIFHECIIHNTLFELSDMNNVIIIDSELNKIVISDSNLVGIKVVNTYMVDFEFNDKLQSKLDEKSFFDKIPIREKTREEFEGLYMIYEVIGNKCRENNLKNNFGEYYYICKKMQRKTLDFIPKIFSYIYDLTCGYGERPLYSIVSSLGIIIIFALLYMFTGFDYNGININYNLNNLVYNDIKLISSNLLKSFTYSVYVFSAVGSNEITPTIVSEVIGDMEIIIGIIMMGIGVGAVTRKLVR
ncbi:pentapeptide repeat-containing protein [Clostridium botulinum]|nr:pentapeptide repeat-containing protein [Clostridium botulinum]